MKLLKRAIANAFKTAQKVLGTDSWVWIGNDAAADAVACIQGVSTRGDKPIMGGGLLHMREADITIHVELSALPEGKRPAASSRFRVGITDVRNDAVQYKVDSVRSLAHLAGWIEIKGSKD